VIVKLKFTVPFDTNPQKVKKLFKKIGAEMMEVPEFADDFLQPFKSQGVFDFDDVGMIIRGKFMAKPGKQFVLRKEIYRATNRKPVSLPLLHKRSIRRPHRKRLNAANRVPLPRTRIRMTLSRSAKGRHVDRSVELEAVARRNLLTILSATTREGYRWR